MIGITQRLPIRLRLTLASAAVMAVVLTGVSVVLYASFQSGLNSSLDDVLHARAADLTGVVQRVGLAELATASQPLPTSRASFAQVLTPEGHVLAGSPGTSSKALLTAAERRRAARSSFVVTRGERVRLLAEPLGPGDVLVVGVSLAKREHTLGTIGNGLMIGGPLALVLASLAAYTLAGRALRPVEAMRHRAARILPASVGKRLPVPRPNDEVRWLGQTLNEMLARLERGLERERAFVADASHELRTPLTILKSELELALRGSQDAVALRAAIESAADETDRLIALANDLLVIASAEQGRLPVRTEELAVDELFANLASRFAQRAGAPHANGGGSHANADGSQPRNGARHARAGASHDDAIFEISVPPGLRVHADRQRLEQALSNLVDNALRYGGRPVRLRAIAADGVIELHVVDHGSGFPAPFVAHAFERFSRPEGNRGQPGNGLGLAIVDAIARAHGGHAEATNATDAGADVALVLPRR
jgi:signal transduction histidine kinase